VPKISEEVPYHWEEVPVQQHFSDDVMETEAKAADMPPSEITFPVRKSLPNPKPVQLEELDIEEQTSGLKVKFSYWSDIVSLSRKDWWYTLVRGKQDNVVHLPDLILLTISILFDCSSGFFVIAPILYHRAGLLLLMTLEINAALF
jgi:hypothetical protein